MDQQPRVRRARADEAPTLAPMLTDLCRRSKAHWGYGADLLARWAGDLRIAAADIERDAVLVAEVGDPVGQGQPSAARVLGFARVTPGPLTSTDQPSPARLNDLWVEPAAIGTGVGAMLFEAACQVARSLPADELLIVADPNAEGFYLRMGARHIGEEASEVVDGRRLPILLVQLHGSASAPTVTWG